MRLPDMAAACAAALALTSACSGARGAAPPPTPPAPHPPGVAVDPELELPGAAGSADTRAGIAVLVEPTGPSRARAVVDSFFEAVVHESVEALSRLLVAGARSRTNSRSGPEPALPFWQKRFDRLDYLAARGEVLYRPRLVEVHTSDSAAALPDRVLAVAPKEGQVIVRVPLAGARSGLFGPEIALVLEPQRGGGYRIQEIVEDFRLP